MKGNDWQEYLVVFEDMDSAAAYLVFTDSKDAAVYAAKERYAKVAYAKSSPSRVEKLDSVIANIDGVEALVEYIE